MTSLGIGILIGIALGWSGYQFYLRTLYKAERKIRRVQRGGSTKRRRHR